MTPRMARPPVEDLIFHKPVAGFRLPTTGKPISEKLSASIESTCDGASQIHPLFVTTQRAELVPHSARPSQSFSGDGSRNQNSSHGMTQGQGRFRTILDPTRVFGFPPPVDPRTPVAPFAESRPLADMP
jgi:hypothetical protein